MGMDPKTEALLYAASRAQLVEEVIKPALAEGKMIICDRFVHSSLVYQGIGRGLGIKEIEGITGKRFEDYPSPFGKDDPVKMRQEMFASKFCSISCTSGRILLVISSNIRWISRLSSASNSLILLFASTTSDGSM